jgi:putative tryptophan/tyrosine transport system substrate-binding protein
MRRRATLLGLAGVLAGAEGTRAQSSVAKRRIGILTATTNEAFFTELKQALAEIGYEEGRNIEIIFRDGRERADSIEQEAQDLVGANVEVIVVWSTGPAQAAMRATQRIPIVALVADATGSGLVKSLARPEANITGLSAQAFTLTAKRVEFLLEALPQARSLAFVGLVGEPNMRRFYDIARKAAHGGIEMRLIEVRGANEIEPALAAVRGDIGGMTFQPIFNPHSRELGALTQKLKLPAAGSYRTFAQAGGLMSIDAVLPEMLRRIARYVDRLLAGVAVADLPFEQAARFHTSSNLRTAAALGLARADEVIE